MAHQFNYSKGNCSCSNSHHKTFLLKLIAAQTLLFRRRFASIEKEKPAIVDCIRHDQSLSRGRTHHCRSRCCSSPRNPPKLRNSSCERPQHCHHQVVRVCKCQLAKHSCGDGKCGHGQDFHSNPRKNIDLSYKELASRCLNHEIGSTNPKKLSGEQLKCKKIETEKNNEHCDKTTGNQFNRSGQGIQKSYDRNICTENVIESLPQSGPGRNFTKEGKEYPRDILPPSNHDPDSLEEKSCPRDDHKTGPKVLEKDEKDVSQRQKAGGKTEKEVMLATITENATNQTEEPSAVRNEETSVTVPESSKENPEIILLREAETEVEKKDEPDTKKLQNLKAATNTTNRPNITDPLIFGGPKEKNFVQNEREPKNTEEQEEFNLEDDYMKTPTKTYAKRATERKELRQSFGIYPELKKRSIIFDDEFKHFDSSLISKGGFYGRSQFDGISPAKTYPHPGDDHPRKLFSGGSSLFYEKEPSTVYTMRDSGNQRKVEGAKKDYRKGSFLDDFKKLNDASSRKNEEAAPHTTSQDGSPHQSCLNKSIQTEPDELFEEVEVVEFSKKLQAVDECTSCQSEGSFLTGNRRSYFDHDDNGTKNNRIGSRFAACLAEFPWVSWKLSLIFLITYVTIVIIHYVVPYFGWFALMGITPRCSLFDFTWRYFSSGEETMEIIF